MDLDKCIKALELIKTIQENKNKKNENINLMIIAEEYIPYIIIGFIILIFYIIYFNFHLNKETFYTTKDKFKKQYR